MMRNIWVTGDVIHWWMLSIIIKQYFITSKAHRKPFIIYICFIVQTINIRKRQNRTGRMHFHSIHLKKRLSWKIVVVSILYLYVSIIQIFRYNIYNIRKRRHSIDTSSFCRYWKSIDNDGYILILLLWFTLWFTFFLFKLFSISVRFDICMMCFFMTVTRKKILLIHGE